MPKKGLYMPLKVYFLESRAAEGCFCQLWYRSLILGQLVLWYSCRTHYPLVANKTRVITK